MSVLKFTNDHEWINIDGNCGIVGITEYACSQLGDLVYVELPELQQQVEKGKEIAVIESVKAASEIYAPLTGTIIECNEEIVNDPTLIQANPLETGWLFKIQFDDQSQCENLMDKQAYKEYIGSL
jgi:glycine cleavage system H protein